MHRMTWYMFFKSVHVIAAVVWVGGATMVQLYALRIVGAKDRAGEAAFAKDTEIIAMRTFIPASVVLLLAAIGMMVNASWPWGQNWVVFGLITWFLSFVIGAAFLGPESGRLAALIEREGPESPAVLARIRRILMVSRCELVFLVGTIWNMVVKPVGQGGWFWGAFVVMLVVVVAILRSWSRAE